MKEQVKERWQLLSWLWPNVATDKGRHDAVKFAAIAVWWIAFSYAAQGAIALLAPNILSDPTIETSGMEGDLGFHLGIAVLVVPLAVFLGWYVRKKVSLAAASAIALWVLAEVVVRIGSGPSGGIVVTLLLGLGAMHGVRATWTARGLKHEQ